MKNSPKIFKDSPDFIHHKLSITNTGIELNQLSKIVYIELNKCLSYIKDHGNDSTECKELYQWLLLLADANEFGTQAIEDTDEEMLQILEELRIMSKNREDLMAMLSEKYAVITKNSELRQARKEGEKRGEQRGERLKEITLICKKLEKGYDLEDIADMLEANITDIQAICDIAKKLGKPYDAKKIYEEV